ncbi:uncharacterized protein LOC9660502 [Selaginella moellendorffii]|uniref:uncharacterized protein LOC9660502 n=1 Tax=Selaginella moellendorffii TaxID=88036 RepID=UPI000D1C34F8|nr:uncharacterized protein LOC9660502 [Selaginella moellendorffii]|eukprot:XP_024525835.1 uncharacterized protein LOC9660502 [Selaginella moellendorffii]
MRGFRVLGASYVQRRGISKWFRAQWCDVRLACGGLPPTQVPVAAIRNPEIIRNSPRRDALHERRLRGHDDECRAEYLAAKRISGVGFQHHGFDCSIDDVRWIGDGQQSVSLIWDLHNKPEGMDPYTAAKRVVEIAGVFGSVVERTAYASRRMLCFLPLFTREYNKVRDFEVVDGEVVERNLSCPLCGDGEARAPHWANLVKHFRLKHERARTKMIYRMHLASGEEKKSWRKILLHQETKYQRAARAVLTPRVLLPDGLPLALIKAGYFVKQMPDKPAKAPDMAVWSHILQVANLGISCICLVCDNVNYTGAMEFARRQNVHTVLIGIGARQKIKEKANLYFSWEEVVTGKALAMAEQAAASWATKQTEPGKSKSKKKKKEPFAVQEDDMFFEYYENLYPSSSGSSEFEWSDSDESD